MTRAWRFRLSAVVAEFLTALLLVIHPFPVAAQVASLNWQAVSPATSPSPRAGHKLVYDRAGAKVLLFGGQSPSGALFNDVWEFDSQTGAWTNVTPATGPAPSPRARFGMAIDESRGVAVVYGGFVGGSPGTNDETWEWNLATRSWAQKANGGIIDSAGRIGAELAFDPNLQMVILFGGLPYWVCPTNAGTYAWSGASWQFVTAAGPNGRVAHAMATDWERGRVVMYGGAGNFDCNSNTELADTWEWDGVAWTKVADTPNRPDTNRGIAMVFDSTVHAIVSFGGYVSQTTWLWDGVSWSNQLSTNPPTARVSALAFDEAASALVLFGGSVGGFPAVWPTGINGGVGDTWLATRRVQTVIAAEPSSGPYGGNATVQVTLRTADGEPVPGRIVSVALGDPASEFTATTDASGIAIVDVALEELLPGEYAVLVRFAGDAEYEPSPDAYSSLVISNRVPVLTWNAPAPITYGTPLGIGQLNATADVNGAFLYSPAAGTVLNAGTHTLQATFTPAEPGYDTVEKSVTLLVTPVTPVVSWAAPLAIVYGTPLSSAQLNATSTISGTFAYLPPAGTILPAGTSQVLSVTFTPDDTTNYTSATKTTNITVTAAVPLIAWSTPQSIVYGTPLSATQLNATANVPGTFAYSPPSGFVFQGGTSTLFANFTPNDRLNYTNATATTSLVVTPAPTTTSLTASSTSITVGQPVVLTATLTVPTNAFNGVPIQFFDGSTPLGTGTAFQVNGVLTATVTRTLLTDNGSPRALTARFAGNNSLQPSVSSVVSIAVAKLPFQYAVVELGTFGGLNAMAQGINSRGDIVGFASFADEFTSHAFWYENGRLNDLGTLGGRTSSAAAINDVGQIVGQSTTTAGAPHAFLWSSGVMTDLGTLGGTFSTATGINDSGDVVGYSYLAGSSTQHGFLYRSGTMIDLGTLGGTNSRAVGVDRNGRVVVNSDTPGNGINNQRVFIWDNGVKRDIGTLGGTLTIARSVSRDGVIVGESAKSDGSTHGFLWANDQFTDLGPITTTLRPATSNRGGQVGGYNQWMTLSEPHGTILRGGLIVDVNSFLPAVTPWRYLSEILAINDNGVAVGYGYFPDSASRTRAYALYPLAPSGITISDGAGTYGQPVMLEARLAASGTDISGKTLRFIVDGSEVGMATTDGSGLATFALTDVLIAGAHSLDVSFAGDLTLAASHTTATLNIAPATPVVTWDTPPPIVYGTRLGRDQLNATASVNGTFAYSPGQGSLLDAGVGQTLTVTFRPTDATNYVPTSTSVNVDVLQATPLALLAVAGQVFVYSQPITIQALIESELLGIHVTGLIEFYIDGQLHETVSSSTGAASIATSSLPVGQHEVWAVYLGNANFKSARTMSHFFTVTRVPTEVQLAASPSASVVEQQIDLTATILNSFGGRSTGLVRFFDDGLLLDTVPIVSGEGISVATTRVSFVQTGLHNLSVEYSGDENFEASMSPLVAHTVSPAQTTTSLTVTPNPAGYGQPITLRAVVVPVSPGAGVAGGIVDFLDGQTLLGSAPLDASASATLVANGLAPGTHALSARYNGSASYVSSTSAAVSTTVQAATASTTTTLTSSKNPSAVGESVTFTATVTPISGSGMPTGTVRFFDGTQQMCVFNGTQQICEFPLVLVRGVMRATLTLATLTAGTHSITAQYSGDSAFNGSTTFAPLLQSVGASTASTTTTVAASPNPAPFGTNVTFTATVKAPGGGKAGTPTGQVQFFADGSPIGSAAVVSGKNGGTATLTGVRLARGYHAIVGQYVGDANFAPSTSSTAVLQVQ